MESGHAGNEGKKGGREEEGKIVEEGTHDTRLSLNLQKHPCIHSLSTWQATKSRFLFCEMNQSRYGEIKVAYRRFILKGFPSFRSTTLLASLNTIGNVSGIWRAGRYFALTRERELLTISTVL